MIRRPGGVEEGMQYEQHATSISFGLLFLSKHREDQ